MEFEVENWMNPQVLWIIAGILMLALEFVVPGLIIFFFGAGAILTGIICMFIDIPIGVQFLIFGVSSVVSLVMLRKKFSASFQGKPGSSENNEDFDEELGKVCVVTEKISSVGGKVEFRGTPWKAVADEEIEQGSNVEIIRKENITLTVKKI